MLAFGVLRGAPTCGGGPLLTPLNVLWYCCMPVQVYQHMRLYYGPQYDIQTGKHHQGYGDEDFYDGFWGKGSLYIDLPRSRVYDASFNCTQGFQVQCTAVSLQKVYLNNAD